MFKQDAFADIAEVFFNEEEFGEWHIFNGKKMLCIVDFNEVEQRGKKQFEHSRIDGIYTDNLLVYVPRKTFGKRAGHGEKIIFDGMPYIVQDCRDEGGVYSIILKALKS